MPVIGSRNSCISSPRVRSSRKREPFASIHRPSLSREIISSTQGVPLTETYFAMTKYISFRVNSSLLSVVRSANARVEMQLAQPLSLSQNAVQRSPVRCSEPFASISSTALADGSTRRTMSKTVPRCRISATSDGPFSVLLSAQPRGARLSCSFCMSVMQPITPT